MPTSSRMADLFGTGSSLRWYPPLMPAEARNDGWQQAWSNGMWGGYLTAVADPSYGRVRVDLYWPGVRYATITRVHTDGTTYDVRGGDPATMCTAWARYDYEAPLDQAVTYQATCTERAGLTVTTGPVTVLSGTRAWLSHPTRPNLNRLVTLSDFGKRNRPARRGVLRPLEGKYPIAVNGVRQAEVGQVTVITNGTAADLASVEALLNDGAELMLRMPAAWGGHSWYISVDTTADDRADSTIGDLLIERVELPFEVVARPPGTAEGGPGNTYAAAGAAFATYGQQANAAASYLELSMMSF